MLVMLTIRPPRPASTMRRAARCAHRKAPSRSTASTSRHWSYVRSRNGTWTPVPASLTIARCGTKSRVSTAMTTSCPRGGRACGDGRGKSADVSAPPVVLVVDVANVMGSRPDGWWRNRAAAAARLLAEIAPLHGSEVTTPDGLPLTVVRLVAVLEGRARDVPAPEGVEAVRATTDGDSAVVALARELV